MENKRRKGRKAWQGGFSKGDDGDGGEQEGKTTDYPLVGTQYDGAGGKYRVVGNATEESADGSAKWSGEETEESE